MRAPRRAPLVVLAGLLAATLGLSGWAAAAPADEGDPLRPLINRLEEVFRSGEPSAYLELLTGTASGDRARAFMAGELREGATRVVIQERERSPFRDAPPGAEYRLVLDAFLEYGNRARASTWRIDVRRAADSRWQIFDEERLSSVENIVRLSMGASSEFDAHGFQLKAEDLDLILDEGKVFTIETDRGITGFILLGRGEMRFHPSPDTERQQVKVFSGSDTLVSPFDAAYVRMGGLTALLDRTHLVPRPVSPRDLQRAEQVFREESPKSFVLDLSDLTRDSWSLLPGANDFLAEVRTKNYDTLTYARSESEPEDISLFDRRRQKNISIYASSAKLAARGRFYSEDDLAAYDILDYDIDVSFTPERLWVEGRARLRLRWRLAGSGQFPLRLADPLVVQSITSDRFGRLFSLRVKHQNTVLVNLPVSPAAGDEVTLTVTYAGRLEPQAPDRETLALQRDPLGPPVVLSGMPLPKLERNFLYSNRSYWYPQAPVTDFATATIRVTLPAAYDCVASGETADGSPVTTDGRKVFLFRAAAPARYLALLVSRLVTVDHLSLAFDTQTPPKTWSGSAPKSVGPARPLNLSVVTNPQHVQQGRTLLAKAADIARFYQGVLGDAPYPGIVVALVENPLPGGHSPAYFAVLNEPPLISAMNWRGDPSAFQGFPDFFLAHELAHQWWGQAVGWQNYHEQWLSEGFAQYFAALYAGQSRSDDLLGSVIRQMRRSAIDASGQGPVYLGYRLGHVSSNGRTFRALIYNKGAVVLHMLRQLLGDDAFFRGLRGFYRESLFRKTGTDALRQVMEAASGQSLDRFFERWIYGSELPRLKWSYRVAEHEAVVRVTQEGNVFDVPLTVTLRYATGKSVDVVVPLHGAETEARIPLESALGSLEIARQDISLAEISRVP